MSIDQKDVVDFIGRSRRTGDITMTIADHLDWTRPREHLVLLRQKIDGYLNIIATGQLAATYPDAEESTIVIQVMFRCAPPAGDATRFLAAVKEQVEAAGCQFRHATPDLTEIAPSENDPFEE